MFAILYKPRNALQRHGKPKVAEMFAVAATNIALECRPVNVGRRRGATGSRGRLIKAHAADGKKSAEIHEELKEKFTTSGSCLPTLSTLRATFETKPRGLAHSSLVVDILTFGRSSPFASQPMLYAAGHPWWHLLRLPETNIGPRCFPNRAKIECHLSKS